MTTKMMTLMMMTTMMMMMMTTTVMTMTTILIYSVKQYMTPTDVDSTWQRNNSLFDIEPAGSTRP